MRMLRFGRKVTVTATAIKDEWVLECFTEERQVWL